MEIVESDANCAEYKKILGYMMSVGLIKNTKSDFSIKRNHE
jgi:hypothetical protein